MSTTACILNGYSFFNNGWGGTDSSPLVDNSSSHLCWGYDSGGRHRWMVLSFTTPDVAAIKSVTFTIKVYNDTKNPTVNYMLSTQAANYGGTDSSGKDAATPTDVLASGTVSLTLAAKTTAAVTFTIDADGLKPNTTYYLWTTTDLWYAGYCGFYSSTPWTAVVEYTPGVVHIDNGTEFVSAIPYIDNGTEWVQAIAYFDNGSGWDTVGS